jgi:hypothetical protein
MNAVLKQENPYAQLFERQLEKSRQLALTTAVQRADKIRRLLKAVLDARPAILEAGYKELRLAPTDIDAQLLMVKSEAEFIARHLEQWMAPQPVPGSLMSLGKPSHVRYEPKGTVLHVSTWNAPIAEAFVPGFGAIAAGCTFTLKPSELAPLGIQATSIVPGGVLTGMSANSHANTRKTWNEQPEAIRRIYEPHLGHVMMQVLPDMLEKTGSSPEQALEGTLKILDKKTWAPMELLGKDVKPMGLMRRLLSDSQLEFVMRKTFKIPAYRA